MSVGWSVHQFISTSVHPSVTSSFLGILGETYIVYTDFFLLQILTRNIDASLFFLSIVTSNIPEDKYRVSGRFDSNRMFRFAVFTSTHVSRVSSAMHMVFSGYFEKMLHPDITLNRGCTNERMYEGMDKRMKEWASRFLTDE